MNSHGRGRPRPLGSMRHSLTIMDNVPKFPPLSQERPSDKFDKHYRGISGSAMTLPPTRLNTDPEKHNDKDFKPQVEHPKVICKIRTPVP